MSTSRISLHSTSRRLNTALFSLAMAPVLFSVSDAWCQPSVLDPIGAEEMFRHGLTALKAGDWETACAKFRKSMDLEPAVSTQFKLAKCSEHSGKLATAWYEFENARKLNRDARVSVQRRAELDTAIRSALVELKPLVPSMSIKIQPDPPGLEVSRDGVPVARSVLGEMLPIDPGDHEVVAHAPGFEEVRRRITLERGRALEVEINLVPSSNRTPVPAETPRTKSNLDSYAANTGSSAMASRSHAAAMPQSPASSSPRWGQRESGFATIGAGAVMLAAAGYFGIRTWTNIKQMDDHKLPDGSYDSGVYGPRDRALKAQMLGFVFAGVGAGLAGVGVGLWLAAPKRVAPPVGSMRDDSYAVVVRGTF